MTVRSFKVLIEYDPEDRLWITYVPALDNLSTYGETRDEAIENTREAIVGYLEAALKEGLQTPTEVPGVELIDIEVAVA